MASDVPPRSPEPIPSEFAGVLVDVTSLQLEQLASSTSQMLASGRDSLDVTAALVEQGWDQGFSHWFVGVYARGGSVLSTPPGQGQPTAEYPRPQLNPDPPGNWWDKQAAPYRQGSGTLWFHVFCCQCPGVIIAALLMMFCRTEQGKENGKRLMIYSGIGLIVSIVLRVILNFAGAGAK